MLLPAHSAAAWAAAGRGDAAAVVEHGAAGLELAVDDAEAVATLVDMARGELLAGAAERALPLARDAVLRGRRVGTGAVVADALQMLGFALVRAGRSADGGSVLVEAIRHYAPADHGWQLETIAGIASPRPRTTGGRAASTRAGRLTALRATAALQPHLYAMGQPGPAAATAAR
jgi:hypothetical protein